MERGRGEEGEEKEEAFLATVCIIFTAYIRNGFYIRPAMAWPTKVFYDYVRQIYSVLSDYSLYDQDTVMKEAS